MKTMIVSAAALMAATGIAAADVKVGVWDGDRFVNIEEAQDERLQLLYLSMPAMAEFIQTRNPELVVSGRDMNGNGILENTEFVVAGDISTWDRDGDGVLSETEYEAGLLSSGAMSADERGILTQDVVGGGEWLAFDIHGENSVTPARYGAEPYIVRIGITAE